MADPTYVFQFDGFRRLSQDRFDYAGTDFVVYSGKAKLGKATSAAEWLVTKFTYDGSGRVVWIQTAGENQIWDNRASLTYFGS